MTKKRLALALSLFLLVLLLINGPRLMDLISGGNTAFDPDTAQQAAGDAIEEGSSSNPSGQGRLNGRDGAKNADGSNGDQTASNPETQQRRVRIYGRVFFSENLIPKEANVYILGFRGAYKPKQYTVRSDSNGNYSFVDDFEGNYLIYASEGPLISYRSRAELTQIYIRPEDVEAGPLDLTLHQAEEMYVSVLDKQNKLPIAGAKIKARGTLNLNFTTDTDGKVRLPLTPGIWSLEINADAYVPEKTAVSLRGHQQPATFLLDPGGVLFGNVTDQEGKPIQDGYVEVSNGVSEFEVPIENGTYALNQLSQERDFFVYFDAPGYKSKSTKWLRFQKDEEEYQLDMQMEAEPSDYEFEYMAVEGVVIDVRGRPIGGATVTSGNAGTTSYATTSTASDGRYAFAAPIVGPMLKLTFSAEGYEPQTNSYLFEGEKVIAEITLLEGYRLSALVVDEENRPIDKVRITGYGYDLFDMLNRNEAARSQVSEWTPQPGRKSNNYPLFDGGSRYTDESGRFELTSLPEHVSITLFAWDHVLQTKQIRLSETNEMVFQLEKQAVLKGEVLDPDNRPVPFFNLKLTMSQGIPDQTWTEEGIHFWSPEGSFEVDRLSPKRPLLVTVTAEGYPKKTVQIAPDQIQQFQTIQLDDGNRRLEGRLVDENGNAVGAARMYLAVYDVADPLNSRFFWNHYYRGIWSSRAEATRQGYSDDQGSFVFDKLPTQGRLDVIVDQPGVGPVHYANLDRLVKAGEAIVLTVKPEAVAEVQLTDWDTAREVTFDRLSDDYARNIKISPGRSYIRVGDLPDGQFRITVREGRQNLFRGEFTLEAGKSIEIDTRGQ